MTTIATLRTARLNPYLHRTDGSARPWSDTECNAFLADALTDLWPDHGVSVVEDLTSDANVDRYTLSSVQRVSRISLLDGLGREVDRVTDWRIVEDSGTRDVIIHPVLSTGLTVRVYGYKPFDVTASDLPTQLEHIVGMLGASYAYGALAAEVTNSERMQNLDSGRIVDASTAASMSAYWQRRADIALARDPTRLSYAPRIARR